MNFMEYLNSFNTDEEEFKRLQIKTNICGEDLCLTNEEKWYVENEVRKMLKTMSYEEIKEMVENWLTNPYGTDIDTYRISLLADFLFYYHSEKINLEQIKKENDVKIMFNKSDNSAKSTSRCM